MKVKGSAFLARRDMLEREIGPDRCARFLRVIAEKEPFFRGEITAATDIPMQAFIRFNEELVKDVYQGDVSSHWKFGEKSAEWAFSEGPLKALLASRNVESFIASVVQIYEGYFSTGSAHATLRGDTAELCIRGVPREFRHPSIEYSIAGYFKRGLELVGARGVAPQRVRGFVDGDDEAVYRFSVVV